MKWFRRLPYSHPELRVCPEIYLLRPSLRSTISGRVDWKHLSSSTFWTYNLSSAMTGLQILWLLYFPPILLIWILVVRLQGDICFFYVQWFSWTTKLLRACNIGILSVESLNLPLVTSARMKGSISISKGRYIFGIIWNSDQFPVYLQRFST